MKNFYIVIIWVLWAGVSLPQVIFAQEKEILVKLKSPLRPEITSFPELLTAILRIFITVATPIVVLFIIFAGFKYVTARGNAQQIQEATRAITYALIGGVLILGAVALAAIITNTVGAITT